ncbi:cell wall-active antibiotics response protein LiaF [Bacillus sp. Marseille-Q1617]|uniref:cell wall-active antibiotics response protein LiaF n=1 Tax=Bacillus sp. Marseille-Q1617 TaxID=2736887 RepID=UPI00158E0DFA|nr:cell wall-active antibiotics response protein LiaF [Bacillus sp. Marseille-Q1617]
MLLILLPFAIYNEYSYRNSEPFIEMNRSEGGVTVRHKGRNQWFFSLLLLMAGVWLLLLNIGVISLEITRDFVKILPILLILIGLKWVVDSFLKNSFGKLFFGLFTLVFGSLIILDEWNIVDFDYGSWWELWPILIISIAIYRVAFKKSIQVTVTNESPYEKKLPVGFEGGRKHEEKTKTNKLKRNFIIGEIKFSEPNWPLEPMKLQNVVGDYYFDMSKAFIPEGETPIEIKGWVGDVKVIIPERVPVDITINVKVGELKLFDRKSSEIRSDFYYQSPGYEESSRKIKLFINVKVASIRISEV